MYLIPANSKKGKLIFNLFRPIDLIIFLIGVGLTLILMMIIKNNDLTITVIKLAPIVVSSFLVMPIPNYHNMMMLIKDVMDFYGSRRVYVWKGWCVRDGIED